MMSEKARLASGTRATAHQPAVHSTKRHAMGRVFAIAATASLIIYGLPRGIYVFPGYPDVAADSF